MGETIVLHLKISYLCNVFEKDGICAAGTKKYRSGQAENSLWAGRKNEVPSTAQDNKPMYNQNTLQTIMTQKAVEKKIKSDNLSMIHT